VQNYCSFATLHNLTPFPATAKTLCFWAAETSIKTSPTTVQRYLSGIRSHHIDLGLPTTVFTDERLKRIIAGARRIHIAIPRTQHDVVTIDILRSLVNSLNTSLFNDVNLHAAFCLAFAAFLRVDDLLSLLRSCVIFSRDMQSLTLILPRSKTDQFGQTTSIFISIAADAKICPVRSLQRLFTRYPRHLTAPLFSHSVGPFTQRWFISQLRSSLLRVGLNPAHFSGHSFRRGAATSALSAGISRSDIMRLGRWKSDSVDRYFSVSSNNANLLSLS